MAALTFLQTLKAEVARMQAAHPEREGELARAHALILHGMVLPSAEDPDTGHVLSSDGHAQYTVNGTCSCQAGQHGQGCKHMQAWRLYKYVERKVAAQTAPVPAAAENCYKNVTVSSALPEAPASINFRAMVGAFETQITLRDTDETRLLARMAALLKQGTLKPVPKPAPRQGPWRQGGRP